MVVVEKPGLDEVIVEDVAIDVDAGVGNDVLLELAASVVVKSLINGAVVELETESFGLVDQKLA